MSKPSNLDYVIGDSAPIRAELIDEIKNEYAKLTGADAPLDAWFYLKRALSDADADAVISKRLGSGIAVVADGFMDIYPTQAETSVLVASFAYYAALRVKTSGGIFTSRFTITMQLSAALPV